MENKGGDDQMYLYIGIGAACFIVLVAVAYYCISKKRKARQEKTQATPQPIATNRMPGKTALPSTMVNPPTPPPPIRSKRMREREESVFSRFEHSDPHPRYAEQMA